MIEIPPCSGCSSPLCPDCHPDAVSDLVTAAQHGDRRALDALLRTVIIPTARAACLTLAGGRRRTCRDAAIDVDDIIQLAVIGAVRALPRYTARDDAAFTSYVYGIARRKVIDAHRADAHARTVTGEDLADLVVDPAPPPDQAAERAADIAAARTTAHQLLADLIPRHRAVLIMRIGHELPTTDVAAALGTTPGAIRITQHRALAHLRARHTRTDTAA